MSWLPLADVQAAFRAKQAAAFRDQLRAHLFENAPASAAVYAAITIHLFVSGATDKQGLADVWLASASLSERSTLFTRLASALLGGRP